MFPQMAPFIIEQDMLYQSNILCCIIGLEFMKITPIKEKFQLASLGKYDSDFPKMSFYVPDIGLGFGDVSDKRAPQK